MKTLTLTLTAAMILGVSAFAAEKKAEPNIKKLPNGHTQEVRYTSAPIAGKGAVITKMIITRDASGRIVSVKRG